MRKLWTLWTFVLIFSILFIRHRGLEEILWGDDQLLVYRALNIPHPPHLRFHPRTSWPSMEWSHLGQFQKFDTLRITEPFNNQIWIIPRGITRILLAISIPDFVRNAMNLLTALFIGAGQAFQVVVTPRRAVSRNFIDLPFQLLKSAYGFVPQAIRDNIIGPLSRMDLLVLVLYPVFMIIAASLLVIFGLRGDRRSQI